MCRARARSYQHLLHPRKRIPRQSKQCFLVLLNHPAFSVMQVKGRIALRIKPQSPTVICYEERNIFHPDRRVRPQGKTDPLVFALHLRHIQPVGMGTDQRNPKKISHRLRNLTKAVKKLLPHIIALPLVLNPRYPLIDIQLLHLVHNIGRRDVSVHIQIHKGIEVLYH